MPAYQDKKTKKWFCKFYYKDWQGERKIGWKRGFETKRDALAWEREFKQMQEGDLEMTFADFVKVYAEDVKPRLKLNTWIGKEYMINDKLIPYFGNRKINEIKSADIIKWQNKLMSEKSKDNRPYSVTYLKTINNQLAAIFNHAMKHYDLKSSPMGKVKPMGMKHAKEMNFWTRDEYMLFSVALKEINSRVYYACEVLYWCGLRMGEMFALTFADVDTEDRTITVNKSYQRLKGEDVITEPKTRKSNRIIKIPRFLAESLIEYKAMLYKPEQNDRMFTFTDHTLRTEMDKATKVAGVKRIRIHDLRHSHVSLLIDMGFSPVAIAERVGHESIEITFRYTHLFPSKQIEMVDRLDGAKADGAQAMCQSRNRDDRDAR